jgi:hypothetical protein
MEWEWEAYLDVLICLFRREGATIAEQVNEAYGDAAVDVEDELPAKSL